MNLYIDKSKNEQGEQEFSIHGLSPRQLDTIQFLLKRSMRVSPYRRMVRTGIVHESIIKGLNTIKDFNPNA